QLARRGEVWRLEAHALESGERAPAAFSASVDVASDAESAQGRVESVPLPLLAAVARSFTPQLPLGQLSLEGVAHELSFDWNARRPAAESLRTSALLEELSIASLSHELTLTGLTAHLALKQADAVLIAKLLGPGALAALGAASAAQLSTGRIENADLEWRGTVDPARAPWSAAGSVFRGAFELRDASLGGLDPWPQL